MRRRLKMAHKAAAKKMRYEGKYIATASFNERNVVASGKNPIEVRKRAVEKGYSSPVVVYVPDKKMYNVF